GVCYWLAGLRDLEAPPARGLYPLHLALPIVMAAALDASSIRSVVWRWLQRAALVLWLLSVSVPVFAWLLHGEPREVGSWRGSWSLVDGKGLLDALREDEVDTVFVTYWTAWPTRFAERVAAREDVRARATSTPPIELNWLLPTEPLPASRKVAFALRRGTRLLAWLERFLATHAVPHRTRDWDGFRILSGIDATTVHRGAGYPRGLGIGALPPYPDHPDGFN